MLVGKAKSLDRLHLISDCIYWVGVVFLIESGSD